MTDRKFISAFIREDIYLIEPREKPGGSSIPIAKYLIITPAPLSDDDLNFLYKVFAAVNISAEMLSISQDDTGFEDYKAVFYFGAEPAHRSIKYYEKIQTEPPTVVVGHSLADIASDQTKKKALWSVLKDLFN